MMNLHDSCLVPCLVLSFSGKKQNKEINYMNQCERKMSLVFGFLVANNKGAYREAQRWVGSIEPQKLPLNQPVCSSKFLIGISKT